MAFNPLDLAGPALNIGGALIGSALSAEDEEAARRLLMEAGGLYNGVQMPNLEAGPSAFGGAPSDFGNRSARNAAIQALMREGLAGGNSLEAQQVQAQAQRAAGQASRQATQGALRSAASRGMGGAASTLQAQLLGASQGADRAAQVGLEGANAARRNALMALQQGGAMAGSAEDSDGARDANRRAALDRMAMFNASQRDAAFKNDMQLRNAKYGAKGDLAGYHRDKARDTRRTWGGIGQGAGYAVAGGKP